MNPQTMFITGQDGKPVMINTADFDAETMTVHGAEAGEENTPPAPPVNPVNPPEAGQPVIPVATVTGTVNPGDAVTMPDGNTTTVETASKSQPVEMFVGKKGKKFIVTNKDGQPIEAEGIEASGYGTEAEAWAAIMARKTG